MLMAPFFPSLDHHDQVSRASDPGLLQPVQDKNLSRCNNNLEVGRVRGCIILVALFALALNIMVKSAEPECRGPKTQSGIQQPPIRAYMDNTTVIAESVQMDHPRARGSSGGQG